MYFVFSSRHHKFCQIHLKSYFFLLRNKYHFKSDIKVLNYDRKLKYSQFVLFKKVLMSRNVVNGLNLSSFNLTVPTIKERPLTPSPLSSPTRSLSICSEPPLGSLDKVKAALQIAIRKRGTKASNTSIDNDVNDFCHEYSLLCGAEKEPILVFMAKELATDHHHVSKLIEQMPGSESSSDDEGAVDALVRWEERLRQSLQPPYYWLMTQVSRTIGGVKFVVDLREDLLTVLGNATAMPRREVTQLKALDAHLRDLLALWFTVGLLDLQRVTWESSCDMLQKVSEYEAVHPIRNWTDLKKRVGQYRRCFVFTHPCMPGEPLVVLHTFLTDRISHSMSQIVSKQRRYMSIDETSGLMKSDENPNAISTAIFYSITSTQKGLKGIELGNYLIKRVVKELKADISHLSQFSSLSPIPGFLKWLQTEIFKARQGDIALFSRGELSAFQECLHASDEMDTYKRLLARLNVADWFGDDAGFSKLIETPLMRLCAYYLYIEKRRGYALNPVANFHLRNGAVLWRLNWGADRSFRGLTNSASIMVNYRYFLDECEDNSMAYLENSELRASESVVFLAKSAVAIRKSHVSDLSTSGLGSSSNSSSSLL